MIAKELILSNNDGATYANMNDPLEYIFLTITFYGMTINAQYIIKDISWRSPAGQNILNRIK